MLSKTGNADHGVNQVATAFQHCNRISALWDVHGNPKDTIAAFEREYGVGNQVQEHATNTLRFVRKFGMNLVNHLSDYEANLPSMRAGAKPLQSTTSIM